MRKIQHLEAVSICVGYADFLAETAKYNIPLFDRYVVVTEARDEETREVCRRMNIECILSDDGRFNGASFAKGRLVERGLQHLSGDGWRLHIDSDMVLPHRFRSLLEAADLQPDTLYGIDRLMCRNWEDWVRVKQSNWLQGGQYDYHCRVNPNHVATKLQMGTRWAHHTMGYCPIGAFQLWHSSQDEWRGVRIKPYPLNHSTSCRTDIQFSLQFDRSKRTLIPEIIAIHLESEPSDKGINWAGRKSKRFGPDSKVPSRMGATYQIGSV